MLRITRITTNEATTLRLEGKLVGAWIRELEALGDRAHADDDRLAIDLSGLTYADAEGVRALRAMIGRGHAVYGGSQFVAELLRQETGS